MARNARWHTTKLNHSVSEFHATPYPFKLCGDLIEKLNGKWLSMWFLGKNEPEVPYKPPPIQCLARAIMPSNVEIFNINHQINVTFGIHVPPASFWRRDLDAVVLGEDRHHDGLSRG